MDRFTKRQLTLVNKLNKVDSIYCEDTKDLLVEFGGRLEDRSRTKESSMSDINETGMDSFQQKVLKRTLELNRIKAGKASETISSEDIATDMRNSPRNSESSNTLLIAQGNTASPRDSHFIGENSERGDIAVGGSGSMEKLWDRVAKMEERMTNRDDKQAEILSHIVMNVAKISKKLDSNRRLESTDITDVDSDLHREDDESQADELDNFMAVDETESRTFLSDLEDSYKETTIFGEEVNDKLSGLLTNAIDRPLKEEQFAKLELKHRVPQNCKSLSVPKVNRELWHTQ